MTEVSIRSYGEYSTGNYGAHCLCVDIGYLRLYFSYNTIVAFNSDKGLIISKNYWSTTTGKHLNWINPNKEIRVNSETFEKELNRVLKKHKLIFN